MKDDPLTCPTCGGRVAGPRYVKFLNGEALEYYCMRCGHKYRTKTLDDDSRNKDGTT